MTGFTTKHYPQLLRYRQEGLQKVGARFTDEIERPAARRFYPTIWRNRVKNDYPSITLGPWRIAGAGPSVVLAHEVLAGRPSIDVLDVGCASGTFRHYLQLRDPARTVTYCGVDIAPPAVDFPVYPSVSAITKNDFDLIFMSEVAEHMPADAFIEECLAPASALLKPNGIAVVGVPNPLAPAVLQRDVTHVQHYPWYDLYAILRFFFDEVDVIRTHFVYGPRRLLSLPVRMSLAYFLEMDWCEGLTAIARKPRAAKPLS